MASRPDRLRKLDVHENDVGLRFDRGRHALLPIGGFEEPIRGRHEKLADDLSVELVVLDVEHGSLTQMTLPSGSRTGTANENVDPLPCVLSTQMRPPCSSTNFFVMLSPRPVPPYSRLMVAST